MDEYVGTLIYDKLTKSILLVENSKSYSVWGFPAGKIDKGESIINAAIREVKGEVNLDIKLDESNFISKHEGTLEYREGIFIVYFYGIDSFTGMPYAQSDAVKLKWFFVDDILANLEEDFFILENKKYLLRDNLKKAIFKFFN